MFFQIRPFLRIALIWWIFFSFGRKRIWSKNGCILNLSSKSYLICGIRITKISWITKYYLNQLKTSYVSRSFANWVFPIEKEKVVTKFYFHIRWIIIQLARVYFYKTRALNKSCKKLFVFLLGNVLSKV